MHGPCTHPEPRPAYHGRRSSHQVASLRGEGGGREPARVVAQRDRLEKDRKTQNREREATRSAARQQQRKTDREQFEHGGQSAMSMQRHSGAK